MNNLNQDQLGQVELLYKHYKKTDLTRSEINDFVKSGKIKKTFQTVQTNARNSTNKQDCPSIAEPIQTTNTIQTVNKSNT